MFVDTLREMNSASRVDTEVDIIFHSICVGCKNAANRGLKEYSYTCARCLRVQSDYDYHSETLTYEYEYAISQEDAKQKKYFSKQEISLIAEKLEEKLKMEGFLTVKVEIKEGCKLNRTRSWGVFTSKEKISETRKTLPSHGIEAKVTW